VARRCCTTGGSAIAREARSAARGDSRAVRPLRALVRAVAEALEGADYGYAVPLWVRRDEAGSTPLELLLAGSVEEVRGTRAQAPAFSQLDLPITSAADALGSAVSDSAVSGVLTPFPRGGKRPGSVHACP